MGLEVATYVSQLTATWPLAGDTKSQGDDHLRLIKSVLQTTFPNASKPYYIPTVELASTLMVLDATDQNNSIGLDVTAGDLTVTLPSTLGASDKGWSCEVYKTAGASTNGIVVSPSSGVIYSGVGATGTATIRIERFFEPVKFTWSGTYWFAVKPGPPVGSSMNWDGATVPAGYRVADGTAYSTTTFAELNAVLGTATLRDKRGRAEVGLDTGNVNMSSAAWGASVTLGSTKLLGTATLGTTNLPAYTPSGSVAVTTIGIKTRSGSFAGSTDDPNSVSEGKSSLTLSNPNNGPIVQPTASFSGSAQGGVATPFSIVQPSIAVNKLVRVC